ncbi:hypothetical protein CAOG_02748 [Capsaspora owczarzaki ATCC 30864]|uniref:hypothetical protein n=1 Tax=Capsaspora owczarzaki (strain ATCC 30864) TaxID=595528 RepID=UPI0001FE4A18|nr:hypothetical protein CAOG_02748 [Capsaspora owczarzaki ATCC 30864]|eukprot:XP_004349498.1 hypothetical protein CAOG_02748 [Capsaspora owczarzaki ATCC 30864]
MAGLHPAGMFIALDMFSADLHEESDPAAAAQAGDGSDDSEAFERQQAAVPNPPAPKRQQIALEPEEEIDVELQQQTEKALSARMKQVFDRASTPTLLAGEVTISSAEFVEGFNTCSLESGVSGSLFVTNYRMAFVATEGSSYTHGTGASSTFDENDVPLTCIVRIYKIINGKRTRLDAMLPESSAALNAIEVRCKFKFVFANTPRFQAIRLVNALFHYAFPTSASRLFAFDYRPPVDVYEEVVKILPSHHPRS